MGVRFTINTRTDSIFKKPKDELFDKEIIVTNLDGSTFIVYDNKYLDENVESLILSTRARKALNRIGITTIRDLTIIYSEASKFQENVKGIGVKSVNEIYGKIDEWQQEVFKSVA